MNEIKKTHLRDLVIRNTHPNTRYRDERARDDRIRRDHFRWKLSTTVFSLITHVNVQHQRQWTSWWNLRDLRIWKWNCLHGWSEAERTRIELFFTSHFALRNLNPYLLMVRMLFLKYTKYLKELLRSRNPWERVNGEVRAVRFWHRSWRSESEEVISVRSSCTWCSSAKRENFNNFCFSRFYYVTKWQEYHSYRSLIKKKITENQCSNAHSIVTNTNSRFALEHRYEALRTNERAAKCAKGRTLRFLANVDPVDVSRALNGLDPEFSRGRRVEIVHDSGDDAERSNSTFLASETLQRQGQRSRRCLEACHCSVC